MVTKFSGGSFKKSISPFCQLAFWLLFGLQIPGMLLRLFVLAFAVCVVLGNDQERQLIDAEKVIASMRENFFSMMEEARNSFIGGKETAVRSRSDRRQNPSACLGPSLSNIASCGTCEIRGVFLNTSSVTRPIDSIPGGAMTMNFFDQFNNRPSTIIPFYISHLTNL